MGIFTAAVHKCLDAEVKPLNSFRDTTMDKGVNKHLRITTYYHFKGDMWITVWELLLYRKRGEKSFVMGSGDRRVSGFRGLMWRGQRCDPGTVKTKEQGEDFQAYSHSFPCSPTKKCL